MQESWAGAPAWTRPMLPLTGKKPPCPLAWVLLLIPREPQGSHKPRNSSLWGALGRAKGFPFNVSCI